MKLGITNNIYHTPGGVTDYKKMSEHGFDACDFQGMSEPFYPLHTMSEDEMSARLTAEKKAAHCFGICHYQVHSCEPVYDENSPVSVSNMEDIKRCVRATSLLDSKYLAVHPVMPYGWGPEADRNVVWEKNRAFFRDLCSYAKEYNVDICLENMPFADHFIARIPDIADFVYEMNFENLQICFDTGHANIFGDDCGEMVLRCGNRLKILHIHDNRRHSDDHSLPYQGNTNWKSFAEGIRKSGYDGCLSLEPAFNKDAPENMRELFCKFSIDVVRNLL